MFGWQPIFTLQLGVSLPKASKNVQFVDLPISFLISFPKKITGDLSKDLATRLLTVELFYNINKKQET